MLIPSSDMLMGSFAGGLGLVLGCLVGCSGAGAGDGTGAGGPGGSGAGGGGTTGVGGFDPTDPCSTDAACASETHTAKVLDLAIYLLVDRSGSMIDTGQWGPAASALESFFASSGATGLRIALDVFPKNDSCFESAYAAPVVELGKLLPEAAPADAHEQALIDALADNAPVAGQGKTPVSAALGGAYLWAEMRKGEVPDERVAVLMITDGKPDGCTSDKENTILQQVDEALAAGVRTFAIGLEGSDQAFLAKLAEHGGTGAAYVLDQAGLSTKLADTLHQVQVEKVECVLPLPTASEPTKLVNVCYAPGGKDEAAVGLVDGASSCGPQGGWYFDDPQSPQSAILCPASCAAVTADVAANIEIVLGCPPPVPR